MKFAFPLRIKFLNLLYNEGVMYMKDFCKWLGVSEKTAKLVICLFVVMAFIVMKNIMLESIGLPFYKLTVENLSKVNVGEIAEFVLSCVIVLLNFYAMIFLVFPIKDFNKIFKYSILYLILDIIISAIFNTIIVNIFILCFVLVFSYLYSNKNKKYILYGLIGYGVSAVVQFVCYLYKIRFIDFTKISGFNKFLVSCDYFLMIFVIILVKEVIIKNKKSKKKGEM